MKQIYIKLSVLILLFIIFLFPITGRADNQIKESETYKENTVKKHWSKEYGYWYYFDETGTMVTGEQTINNKIYTFNNKTDNEYPYGALIEDGTVKINKEHITGLTYLELMPNNNEYKEIVIMLHGLGGSKEDYKHYGTELASDGYLVLLPDAYAHGEIYQEGTYPEIIEKSSESINDLLDIYNYDNNYKVNIIGCSMGGMIGAHYVYKGKYPIERLSMLVSTMDFTSLEDEMFYKTYVFGNPKREENDKEEILSELQRITPLNNILMFKNTKIQMINSKDDPYIPYKTLENFQTELKKETTVKIEETILDGHKVIRDDFWKSFDFIKEHKDN